ncbi:MAG: VacJ family lipoprotein [Pseudomonadota bacterium]
MRQPDISPAFKRPGIGAFALRASAFAAVVLLAGCAAAPADDPLAGVNRPVHAFNKGLDTVALRPASQVYGAVAPTPVRQGVSNFADNLSTPGDMVNNGLQGDLDGFARNTFRLLMNSTVGVLGIWDVASAMGVEPEETDFGETLHVWGVGEGAYVELPVFGPSTTRDAFGTVVDFVIDPVGTTLDGREADYALGARVGSVLDTRERFSTTIDSVLYDSADSYSQSRLIYLQNRRFELGGDDAQQTIDTESDLYADF